MLTEIRHSQKNISTYSMNAMEYDVVSLEANMFEVMDGDRKLVPGLVDNDSFLSLRPNKE